MTVTMPRTMLIACLLSPSLSWALGLGEIHLNSSLNEPMNAEIDLIAAAPDELAALRATLASREAFTRYGIDKPPFLASLTFKVGKAKDGRDVLLVHSLDAIPEPFVTFLVEVNWARGRLMREYTVLLDPALYTPGENANSAAPVTAPSTGPAASTAGAPAAASPGAGSPAAGSPVASSAGPSRRNTQPIAPSGAESGAAAPASNAGASEVRVGKGDNLTKIARSLRASPASQADIDQTMIALYRANHDAFGGNINVLRQGAVLRVPDADQVAALNQKEAMGEVHRQMETWRSGETAPSGHLRLVAPVAGGSASGAGTPASSSSSAASGAGGDTQALRDRVKDLEGQLADSKRLIDLRSSELAALQRKLGTAPSSAATPPASAAMPPATVPPPAPVPVPPSAVPAPSTVAQPPASATPPPDAANPAPTSPPDAVVPAVPPPAVVVAPSTKKPAAAPADTGSWMDWVAQNWWAPVALLLVVLGALGIAAMRRRRRETGNDLGNFTEDPDLDDPHDPTSKLGSPRKGNDSFVVEESGSHPMPDLGEEGGRFAETSEMKSTEDTLSSESAVNLDQGDPLAEADFHMAYGLYDQAADLVRIALEREPDRRDLRLKLLEIYFVWGNKDAFLQTAKGLEATRDRAPAGEWDKIVIMGKQICPDEPMFAAKGGGRGAGALVDLNLEGGENRVDIDLFGDPEGERSTLDHPLAKEHDDVAATMESPALQGARGHLDFTLDAPERGADESPTREMAPRDEPTVESELMNFGDANFIDPPDNGAASSDQPTAESPALKLAERGSSRAAIRADQTAEVSIDDLGLDLDHLEETGSASSHSIPYMGDSDHPADAPTMVAGLDERSRMMMAEAAKKAARDGELSSRERDLTELERELEASFVADMDSHNEEIKTAVLGPESAPTVLMPRDLESTSRLRGLNGDSIDLDLDRLASALGSGDTVQQPRAAEEVFSSEVFEASQRNKRVDLDVGDAMVGSDGPTNRLQAQTNKLQPLDLSAPDLEPVTMSEVGTKLDLARAYMDMGDPEGARSILEEVVHEGSASQKQEASRLIESLPG